MQCSAVHRMPDAIMRLVRLYYADLLPTRYQTSIHRFGPENDFPSSAAAFDGGNLQATLPSAEL